MSYSPFYLNKVGMGSSRQTITNFQNGSGSTLAKATPVAVSGTGQLETVDVSNEASILRMVGLTGMSIPNAATGQVVDNGRLEDVTTGFSVGDPVYVSKTGGLMNTKPDIGVSGFAEGDFVIFVGIVVKNEFDAMLQDIKLMISVIGQL